MNVDEWDLGVITASNAAKNASSKFSKLREAVKDKLTRTFDGRSANDVTINDTATGYRVDVKKEGGILPSRFKRDFEGHFTGDRRVKTELRQDDEMAHFHVDFDPSYSQSILGASWSRALVYCAACFLCFAAANYLAL